jgi:hypothetical protein
MNNAIVLDPSEGCCEGAQYIFIELAYPDSPLLSDFTFYWDDLELKHDNIRMSTNGFFIKSLPGNFGTSVVVRVSTKYWSCSAYFHYTHYLKPVEGLLKDEI